MGPVKAVVVVVANNARRDAKANFMVVDFFWVEYEEQLALWGGLFLMCKRRCMIVVVQQWSIMAYQYSSTTI